MPESIITPADRQTAVWMKIEKYYRDRLDSLRSQNDGNHDANATQKLRGRIAECKHFLALAEPAPKVSDDA